MKRMVIRFVLLGGMLAGSAGALHAETLEGMITSIDSKNTVLRIAPSDPAGFGTDVSVSVSEFVRTHGSAQLDDLDVGKTVSMTIRKRSDGRWKMVSLKKPDVLAPAVTEDVGYLKETIPNPPAGPLRDERNLLRASEKELALQK